jgi:hypothetical protein
MAPLGAPQQSPAGQSGYLSSGREGARCLEPETGSVPEALLLLLSQKLCSFCSSHIHLCRLVTEGSWNQDGSPRCLVSSLALEIKVKKLDEPQKRI